MTKKKIRREVSHIDLEGSLDNAIKQLSDLRDTYGGDAVIDTDYRDKWSDDNTEDYFLYVVEEESDVVYQTRVLTEANAKRLRDEHDRELFLKLKEKYGQ